MKTLDQIKAGLNADEFYLEYLPTMSLVNNQCVGAEALARWQHHKEKILPDEFIPVIENTPVSGLLTYWVIEAVARDLGDWLKETDNIHIGINIPPDVLGRGGLEYAATKAGLMDVADKLLIEITERGFPDKQALDSLMGKQVRTKIAIDDFGTGTANLMQLSQMYTDMIKIDKYFVDQISAEGNPPKILKGLTAFGLAMEFEMIAEGVETEQQARTLKHLGVQMAQGWYFSRPLSTLAFINFHSSHKH